MSRHCRKGSPNMGKAGRLGNDRPSLGARLGVGYRSLGVCGKGASMKRPGEPPAGYLNFSAAAPVSRHQISKRTPQEWKRSTTNVFNTRTLPKHIAFCHLQKCIPRFFSGFKFLTNFDSSRHMINKKGIQIARKIDSWDRFVRIFNRLDSSIHFGKSVSSAKYIPGHDSPIPSCQRAAVPSTSVPC